MTADSLDWPALALGTVGAEFEVVGPPELADHIREWGARFTRATGAEDLVTSWGEAGRVEAGEQQCASSVLAALCSRLTTIASQAGSRSGERPGQQRAHLGQSRVHVAGRGSRPARRCRG